MGLLKINLKEIAFKHPVASLLFLLGKKNMLHESIILNSSRLLFEKSVHKSEWKKALHEIEKDDFIPMSKTKDLINVPGNSVHTTFGKWIYCVVRVFKPEVMIETGVAHGASSWIILNAMNKNRQGKLYSIDMANKDKNINYNFKNQPETGWLVPDALRGRWKLILGDAQIVLPSLLKELKMIDVFFHDSAHTYEHMKFEFESVFPFMKKSGIIISDDVKRNNAFSEFVSMNNLKAIQFHKGGCALI